MIVITTLRWVYVPVLLEVQTFIVAAVSLMLLIQLFLLGVMVIFHLYFVSKNMTTIDWYCCRYLFWNRVHQGRGKGSGHSFDYGLYTNITQTLGYLPFLLCPRNFWEFSDLMILVRFGILRDATSFEPTNPPPANYEKLSNQINWSNKSIDSFTVFLNNLQNIVWVSSSLLQESLIEFLETEVLQLLDTILTQERS